MTIQQMIRELMAYGKSQMWIAQQIGAQQSSVSRLSSGEQKELPHMRWVRLERLHRRTVQKQARKA